MYGQVSTDTGGSKPAPVTPRVEQYAPVPQERSTQPPETPRVKKQPPAPQGRKIQSPETPRVEQQPPVSQERATQPPVPQKRATQPPVPQKRATQPPVPQERATQPPVPQGGAQQPHPLIYRANRPVIATESEKSFAYGPNPFPINRFNTSYGHMTNMTWCLVCRERQVPPYRDRFHYHTSLYRLQDKLLRRNIDVMDCPVVQAQAPHQPGEGPHAVDQLYAAQCLC